MRDLGIIALISFGLCSVAPVQADEKPAPSRRAKLPAYTLKPALIVPSPDGYGYIGHFSFIHQGTEPVYVSGFDEPLDGKFIPRFIGYEKLAKDKWIDVPVGYCGTGAMSYEMKPKVPYEFIVRLYSFEEQEAPLTGRIELDGFRSEPFVLDWKKDRASGAFAAARKAHFEKLRAAFTKAGFDPKMIEGDDFVKRLIGSMLNAMVADKENGFVKFEGDLDFVPEIQLNGGIRIDLYSDNEGVTPSVYHGWLVLNPKKFTRAWLKNEAPKHIKADDSGVHRLDMELDDGTDRWSMDNTLWIKIGYTKANGRSFDTAKQTMAKMLDALDTWLLKDSPKKEAK